ncbi:hypothetical protein QBC43DRAFT_337851 [Cladorrhinum sp. PSN259]|nr:hypothetical protein QBC43DRAFT_337851 [Cladorrhinum sp. PSN259]
MASPELMAQALLEGNSPLADVDPPFIAPSREWSREERFPQIRISLLSSPLDLWVWRWVRVLCLEVADVVALWYRWEHSISPRAVGNAERLKAVLAAMHYRLNRTHPRDRSAALGCRSVRLVKSDSRCKVINPINIKPSRGAATPHDRLTAVEEHDDRVKKGLGAIEPGHVVSGKCNAGEAGRLGHRMNQISGPGEDRRG